MAEFELVYHPDVRQDIPRIPGNIRVRLERAIRARLARQPQAYGLPLRKSLAGWWKLRVGDYRVVFRIERREVWIFAILHRRIVYDLAAARTAWRPSDSS